MEDPHDKLAPCVVYFWAHGGRFTEDGRPIKGDQDRLLCGKAFDCGHCDFLQSWVASAVQSGFVATWECVRCVQKSKKPDAANGVERRVHGIYQAGQRSDVDPDSLEYDDDRPGVQGCQHIYEFDDDEVEPPKRAGEVCGWESSFLQLVLRRKVSGR